MKTLLLCPPPGDLSQPYVALPALTATLRREGREVQQRDLTPEFFAYLRQPAVYGALLDRVEARHRHEEAGGWNDPLRALLLNDDTLERLDEAVAILQDPERYYQPELFASARNRVRALFRLASAAYPRWELDLFQVTPPISPLLPVDEVLDLLTRLDDSPFHAFFQERVVPPPAPAAEEPWPPPGPFPPASLTTALPPRAAPPRPPELVGISVTFGQQLLPALHLAQLVRERWPHSRVVLGGAAVTNFHRTFRAHPELFTLVDGVVLGDGETALGEIVTRLEQGRELAGVPNLLCRVAGEVVAGPSHEEDLAALPTPDYDGLPLAAYLVPEPTLIVPVSRGCTWGRCGFCNFDALRCSYRERPVEQIATDLGTLQERHGATAFYLSGNTVRPATLARLADALLATGQSYRWVVELRLDRGHKAETFQAMYRAGCRSVLFGLESASQRVQDLMNKGYQVDWFPTILAAAAGAGLRVGIESFIGFPGETAAEAAQTARFLVEHREEIAFFTLGTFVLDPNSIVARRPAEYGVEVAGPPVADTFARYLPFRQTGDAARTEEEIQQQNRELYDQLAEFFPYTRERFGQGIGGPDPMLYAMRYPASFFRTAPATRAAPPAEDLRDLLARIPTWAPGVHVRRPARHLLEPTADGRPPLLLVREEDAAYLALAGSAEALLRRVDGRRPLAMIVRDSVLGTQQSLEVLLDVAAEGYLLLALPRPTTARS